MCFPLPLTKLSGKNGLKDIGCKQLRGSSQRLDPEIFGGFLSTQSETLGEGNKLPYHQVAQGEIPASKEHPPLPILSLLHPSLSFLKSVLDVIIPSSCGGKLAQSAWEEKR